MNRLILALCFLICEGYIYATPQVLDRIKLNGVTYYLAHFPLERYFEVNPIDNKDSVRVVSTSLWRGYVATFEVENDSLFVADLSKLKFMDGRSDYVSFMNQVFPNCKRFFYQFYSGVIVMHDGEFSIYGSSSQRYILLEVQNGIITDREDVTERGFRAFRVHQFNKYRKTNDYKKQYDLLRQKNNTPRGDTIAREWIEYRIMDYLPRFLK